MLHTNAVWRTLWHCGGKKKKLEYGCIQFLHLGNAATSFSILFCILHCVRLCVSGWVHLCVFMHVLRKDGIVYNSAS